MRLMNRPSKGVLWPALQTNSQGVAGTMLKEAFDAHAQLVPSRC